VRSQKYQGLEYPDGRGKTFAGESESARSAVNATRGIVLTHQGRSFRTYYSAVCGGATTPGTTIFTDAAWPHQTVPCQYCQASTYYRWTRQLKPQEFEIGAAKALGQPVHQIHSHELSLTGVPGQRLAQLSTQTGRTTTGIELRQSFESGTLPSPKFIGKYDGKDWHIEGGGHGHGVGLCQWGAKGLAEQGATAAQILNYYYRDVRLVPYRAQ
jgi:stage II sporulation protein D